MDINHGKMFTYLKVPWAKTLNDVLAVSKRKLTSARNELDSNFSTEEVYEALVKGFEKALNAKFAKTELTDDEQQLTKRLKKERYATEEWNYLAEASI